MALQNDVRIYGRASLLARIRDLVLDKTIKHGYQPLRAVVALVALHMITPSGFWAAQHQGVHRADGATDVIVPSRTINEERPPTGRVCVPDSRASTRRVWQQTLATDHQFAAGRGLTSWWESSLRPRVDPTYYGRHPAWEGGDDTRRCGLHGTRAKSETEAISRRPARHPAKPRFPESGLLRR